MSTPRCGHCAAYQRSESDARRGECRAHPPMARREDVQGERLGWWPLVMLDAWCLQFRARAVTGGQQLGLKLPRSPAPGANVACMPPAPAASPVVDGEMARPGQCRDCRWFQTERRDRDDDRGLCSLDAAAGQHSFLARPVVRCNHSCSRFERDASSHD